MRFAIGSPSDGRRGEHGHMSVVSKKRIHELAKDWNVPTKDVLAKIERLGIRNKKSQSSLSDDQIAKVREALGLRDKTTVTIGAERVVSERVVTEKDATEDQMITSREQVVENRVRANVIRRRTTRVEVLKREDIPVPPPEAAPMATFEPADADLEVDDGTAMPIFPADSGAPPAVEIDEPVAAEAA